MRLVLGYGLALMCALVPTACDRHITEPDDISPERKFLQEAWQSRLPSGDSKAVQVGEWAYVVNNRTLITFDLKEPANPRIVDKLTTSGYVDGLAADDACIYLSTSTGLHIYDVSPAGKPELIGNCCKQSVEPYRMIANNDRLYWVSNREFGIVDIPTSGSLTELGSVYLYSGWVSDLAVVGNYAYLWSSGGTYIGAGGLSVVDISDPRNPTVVVVDSSSSYAKASLQAVGEYLYVTGSTGTRLYNISVPLEPVLAGSLVQPKSDLCPTFLCENNLFATSGRAIRVYNVVAPTAPVLRSITALPFYPDCLSLCGNHLMVSNYDSLAVFSIADPAAPTAKSLLELRHAYSLSGGDTLGMLADGHLGLLPVTDRWLGPTHSVTRGEAKDAAIDHSGNVYVADGDSGLTILATGNTSTQTGHLNLPGNSCAVAKSGSRCFVGTTEGGLYVIDVINRAVPRLLDSVKLPGPIADIAAVDSLVAVASGPGGLHILNVGRQSEVTVLLSLTDTGPVYHAVATHTQVFYIEQGAGINAINIDDPAHPGAARQIVKGEGQFFVNDGDMDLYHNYILAASRNRAYLIDTNNPSSGVLSQYIGTSSCRSLAVRDGRKTLTILSEGWVHHYTIR